MGLFGLWQKYILDLYIGFEFGKRVRQPAYSICYNYGVYALEVGPDYSLHVRCRLGYGLRYRDRLWFIKARFCVMVSLKQETSPCISDSPSGTQACVTLQDKLALLFLPAQCTKSRCAWWKSYHPYMEKCNRSLTESTKNKQSNPESKVVFFPMVLLRKTNKV